MIIDTIVKLCTSPLPEDWELAYKYATELARFDKLDLRHALKANAHIIQSGAKLRLEYFYR